LSCAVAILTWLQTTSPISFVARCTPRLHQVGASPPMRHDSPLSYRSAVTQAHHSRSPAVIAPIFFASRTHSAVWNLVAATPTSVSASSCSSSEH
jgi:hypothetical protein